MTHSNRLPGEMPHVPPPDLLRHRLQRYTPYVREAQESARAPWRLAPRKLFDYLLVHQLEGSGVFTVGTERFETQAGDTIWIPPDTLHEMEGFGPRTVYQHVHFDILYDPERSHWHAIIPGGTSDLSPWQSYMHPPLNDPLIDGWCGKLPGGRPSLISDILRRVILEYQQTSNLLISGLMNQLLGHLLKSAHPRAGRDTQHTHTLDTAMEQIQRQSHGVLGIETIAASCHLSTTHFRKLFRDQFGQSPREAHVSAKMRAACDYLIYSDLNISQIADRLGFTTVHNFSRAFRKVVGQPPGAYRAGETPRRL